MCALADPGMGEPGGRPLDQNRGFLLFKYLTFGPFLYENRRKTFSCRGLRPNPPQGALSLDPAIGALPQTSVISWRSTRSPWYVPLPFDKSWIRPCICGFVRGSYS